MKKIFLPMLALAVLASCSKSENGSDDNSGTLVPIRLGADVETSTKAPVVSGSVNAGIAGWENASAETYAAAPLWNTDITSAVNSTTGQSVNWTTPKYYNADDAQKTYMKAWYPKGILSGSAVTFANTDGSVDVLLAPAINGSKTDALDKTLAFTHKSAQLKFKVVEGTGLVAGTKIKRITLNSVQLPVGFDLTKDATDASVVTWSTAATLNIPNLTEAVIGATAAAVGDAVMIKPQADNSLTIEVETSGATYTAKTFITSDSKLSESSAYEVTLTFGQSGIGLKATIAEWTDATGSGTIE